MCAMITSSMADTLFGTKNSVNSGSFLSASSLGDWSLMRSGVYTRMLRSYYEKTSAEETTDKTKTDAFKSEISTKLDYLQGSTTDTVLSDIKSAAGTLDSAAQKVADMDYEGKSREEMYSDVETLVESYNAVVNCASKSDLVSITKSVDWMKEDTQMLKDDLKEIGISVGATGKLSVNKDTFMQADEKAVRELLEGSGGLASSIAKRASGISTLAANQMAANAGKTFYSANGILGQ